MKVQYQEKFFSDGHEIQGQFKTIELPFSRVGARAVILRISDKAILGVLHRPDGKFAPPGGAVEDNETSADAILRELAEEEINLIGSDNNWGSRIHLHYYEGYKVLSIWYLFLVEEVELGDSEEIIEAKWIHQGENVWYPWMREHISIMIKKYLPTCS